MTFKPPDCSKCDNRGYVIMSRYPDFTIAAIGKIPDLPKREKVACDCYWGEQWQITEDRMLHPEYENPFSKMTDDETIKTINATLDYQEARQEAIDSEFNI